MRLFVTLLRSVIRGVCRRPRTVLVVAALLSLLAGWLGITRLTLVSDQDVLVSETLPFQKNYLAYLRNFGDLEYLYVVIDGTEPGRAKAFADDLATRLSHHPELIQDVMYRIGPDELGDGMLLYLEPEQVRTLGRTVEQIATDLTPVLATGQLSVLFDWIGTRLSAPQNQQSGELAPLFMVLGPLFEGLAETLATDAPYRSPFSSFSDDQLQQYTFTVNGRFLIMLVQVPKDFTTTQVIEQPLNVLRVALQESRAQFPGLDAGITGRPVLQADEMATSTHDMTLATIMAIIGVSLLFVVSFRAVWRPLLAVVTLLVSIVWTFGWAAITVGSLNLLSTVFTLVIVGIGINYGMHILARYLEERERGLTADQALERSMVTAGVGNLTCAATSAAAFFCALLTDFKALAELGFIAGSGIFLSLIAMMTVYPAIIYLLDHRLINQHTPQQEYPRRHMIRLRVLGRLLGRPWLVLAIVAAITLALLPWVPRITFDDNLLMLQSQELESVQWELALIEESGESTWFAASQVDTLDAVRSLSRRFSLLPTVSKVESLLDALPTDQDEKRALLTQSAGRLAALTVPHDAPADPEKVRRALTRIQDGLEMIEEKLFVAGREDEVLHITTLLETVDRAVSTIDPAPAQHGIAERLSSYQQAFMADLRNQLERWRPRFTPDGVTEQSLPHVVRSHFIGHDGRYLITITPDEDIWDPQAMASFVSDLRTIDPLVTGPPITSYEAARLMRRAFQETAIFSVVAVAALIWMHFGRWRAVLLAFIPLVTGLTWLFGAMGLFGISLNLANFFAIPILIGIGIDGGIQMVQRMHEEPRRPMLETSTATSIALSSMTTLIAFGSLMLGHHRGVASLGQVMALGIISILVATTIILPSIHELLVRRRPGRR